jgi:purine-nucleoside phosphorylase
LIRLTDAGLLPESARQGVHVAVPGPQYETEAENDLLRDLGADCVSMSLPGELRAARETGLEVAALSLITNAGVATHEDVLATAADQGDSLAAVILAVLAAWQAI